jgi:hypothetical protein
MDPRRIGPYLALIVGGAFVLAAILRPAFLWELGRVRSGREWFGETGARLFYGGMGVLFLALGGFLARRGRR